MNRKVLFKKLFSLLIGLVGLTVAFIIYSHVEEYNVQYIFLGHTSTVPEVSWHYSVTCLLFLFFIPYTFGQAFGLWYFFKHKIK